MPLLSTETLSDLQQLHFPPTPLAVRRRPRRLEDGMEADRVDEGQLQDETITMIKQMMIGSLRELELLLGVERQDQGHQRREGALEDSQVVQQEAEEVEGKVQREDRELTFISEDSRIRVEIDSRAVVEGRHLPREATETRTDLEVAVVDTIVLETGIVGRNRTRAQKREMEEGVMQDLANLLHYWIESEVDQAEKGVEEDRQENLVIKEGMFDSFPLLFVLLVLSRMLQLNYLAYSLMYRLLQ